MIVSPRWGCGVEVYKGESPPDIGHGYNTSPKRSIATESGVHQVSRGTVILDADDFVLPELELEPEPESEPELVLEFDVVPVPVPGSELLSEAVTWPEISETKKMDISEHLVCRR